MGKYVHLPPLKIQKFTTHLIHWCKIYRTWNAYIWYTKKQHSDQQNKLDMNSTHFTIYTVKKSIICFIPLHWGCAPKGIATLRSVLGDNGILLQEAVLGLKLTVHCNLLASLLKTNDQMNVIALIYYVILLKWFFANNKWRWKLEMLCRMQSPRCYVQRLVRYAICSHRNTLFFSLCVYPNSEKS